MSRLALVLPALCAGVLVAATSPALATFPGQNGRIAFDSDRHGGDIDLWTMRPGGGGQRNLTKGSDAVDGAANWSPDGRKIAFMSDRETARNPDPRGKTGPDFEIFVMNARGGNVRQVTDNELDDEDPAWSPNGRRIVFQRDLNPVRGKINYDLFTMAADGTDERRLTDSRGVDDLQPNWSSRGRIVFTSDRDGDDLELYTMRPDGSKVRRLTSNRHNEEFPNWTPNGRKVLFHSEHDGNFDVYRIRRNGGGVERLTSADTGEGLPAPSPDGRLIAFFSERGSPDLFTMRRGGGGQTNRTNSEAFEFAPDWQARPR